MLYVEFKPKKPEYEKYICDLRFICQKITYGDKTMIFHKLWGKDGWNREVIIDTELYDIEINEVK